tara:strand:+ start:506 stop:1969 length:1464 start_codon:yes stop_codon:yes gene_type:complete
MNKEIKLNSIEGGPFTTSQNRVSFEIPSDGVYDLQSSYINLNCEIQVTETSTVEGIGIYPMDVLVGGTGTDRPQYPNTSLVKNCSMRTARKGMVEDIRRSDQLQNLIYTLNRSETQKDSRSYEAVSQIVNQVNVQQYGIYRDINKVGTVKSKQNDIAPIKIKLEDLFDFCAQAVEVDTQKCGTITVRCELNIDKLTPIQRFKSDDWPDALKSNFDVLNAQGDANTIQTKTKFTNLDQTAYYVGQKLKVSATGGGGAGNVTDKDAVIDQIVWNDDGTISLSFEQKWGDIGVGESYSDIEVATQDIASATISVNFAEIVLTRLAKDKTDFDKIEYSTYSTEQTNGNGLTSFQNQFQIEAESDAVLIAFPADNDDLQSVNGAIESYRLRLDNVDLTDRDVEMDGPLHYDRLNMTMTQLRMRLRDLSQNLRNVDESNYLDSILDPDTTTNMILTPVQQKVQEKLLQVNINATGAGVKKLSLFKHLPRVFSY